MTVGYTVIGLNDITQLLVMGFVSLSLPITFLREQNVKVEFIAGLLPRRALAWLHPVIALLSTAFVAGLAWFAWVQAARQFAEGTGSSTLCIRWRITGGRARRHQPVGALLRRAGAALHRRGLFILP